MAGHAVEGLTQPPDLVPSLHCDAAIQVPGGDLWQIFVNDPNGVMIELNYEAAREQGGSAPLERADDVGAR